MRIDNFIRRNEGGLFVTDDIKRIHEDIYSYPLREYAREVISRELKSGISDDKLIELVSGLRERGVLSQKDDQEQIAKDPRIICSMGLKS
jgi:hypothetical protein